MFLSITLEGWTVISSSVLLYSFVGWRSSLEGIDTATICNGRLNTGRTCSLDNLRNNAY